MNIEFETIYGFDREFKRLYKRYKSLPADLKQLMQRLKENPNQGTSLGNKVFKIRMAVHSKSRGKRGGLRVITYNDILIMSQKGTITFITIYDKSERSSISQKEIQSLIKEGMNRNQ